MANIKDYKLKMLKSNEEFHNCLKMNLDNIVDQLLPIAQGAGEIILSIYEKVGIDTWEKSDKSPVTEADLAAHNFLVGRCICACN
jgi:fructose-1,6-bisphosphatase/inositol monophosphatase family enzyme